MVETSGVPDPTFGDKNGCKHTYVSPRDVGDFGLTNPLECSKGGGEEPSAYKPDPVKKPAAKKEAAPPEAAFV